MNRIRQVTKGDIYRQATAIKFRSSSSNEFHSIVQRFLVVVDMQMMRRSKKKKKLAKTKKKCKSVGKLDNSSLGPLSAESWSARFSPQQGTKMKNTETKK